MTGAGAYSIASTALSTGADIYNAINAGIIKSIQYGEAAKTEESKARLHSLDSTAQLSALQMQFKEQMANLSKDHTNITENQQMVVATQNRTLDSLDRIQSDDDINIKNKEINTILNRDRSKIAIEGEDKEFTLGAMARASNDRFAGKIGMINARAQAGSLLANGAESVVKNMVIPTSGGKK